MKKKNLKHDTDYSYVITKHPITQDAMWLIENDLFFIEHGIRSLVEKFINQYPHDGEDYTLTLYDIWSENVVDIDCKTEEMPHFANSVYCLENAAALTFIGVNSYSKSYVVGIGFGRGNIDFDCYKAVNGKLEKIAEITKR